MSQRIVLLLTMMLYSVSSFGLIASHMSRRRLAPYIFNNDTTITSTNVNLFRFRDWIVRTGVTVTINYDQNIKIGNLTLEGTATMTHPVCVSAPCAVIDLEIVGNATIPSGTSIAVYGKGYRGGYQSGNNTTTGITNGNTTTGGSIKNGGGSHGGYGGYYSGAAANIPGSPYGNFMQPYSYGGGGGAASATYSGGNGGGIIKLVISGTLSLDGELNVGGADTPASAPGCGGGAGGSLWVSADTITTTKTSPIFIAWGGDNTYTNSAGGGGGRIAIYYNTLAGSMSMTGTMAGGGGNVRMDGGWGYNTGNFGGSGTLYAKKNSDTYGSIYFWSQSAASSYMETPFPQLANQTYKLIYVYGGKVKMLNTTYSITSSATQVDGSTGGNLMIPTNGAAGYGSWFVPGTITYTNSGTISEY